MPVKVARVEEIDYQVGDKIIAGEHSQFHGRAFFTYGGRDSVNSTNFMSLEVWFLEDGAITEL